MNAPGKTPKRTTVLPALAPASGVLLILMVIPLLGMIIISFKREAFGLIQPDVTLENYVSLLTDWDSLTLMLSTLGVAAVVTFLCVLSGFPLATVIARAAPRRRALLYFLVTAPLLINTVVRSYGWLLILGRQGLLNQLLLAAGWIDTPLALSGNLFGVIIGGTQVFLPFMVLSLAASLQTIDPRLRESSSILGAGHWRTFWRITLPLSLPGLIAGCVLVFSLMLGAFVTPLILGGSSVRYLSVQVYTDALVLFNLPRATALALLLMVVVLLVYALQKRLTRRAEAALV